MSTAKISFPKLVSVDWRVDTKSASSFGGRRNEPSVTLALEVQDEQVHADVMPGLKTVAVELDKDTLNTMLSAMNKISEQLSVIASQ